MGALSLFHLTFYLISPRLRFQILLEALKTSNSGALPQGAGRIPSDPGEESGLKMPGVDEEPSVQCCQGGG